MSEVRETMSNYGSKALSEVQLLEVLGVPNVAARELMIRADHMLAAIAKMSLTEIAEVKGIGLAKAQAITAAIEIGRRRQTENVAFKKCIASSCDAYEIVQAQMRDLNHEEFWVIYCDRRSKVIKTVCVHIGGMSAMVVDPKCVFQKALELKASSMILVHNHPSGSPSPSIEDIRLTEKMKAAGNVIDIKVLDHIIIGDGEYYSFADEGKL